MRSDHRVKLRKDFVPGQLMVGKPETGSVHTNNEIQGLVQYNSWQNEGTEQPVRGRNTKNTK